MFQNEYLLSPVNLTDLSNPNFLAELNVGVVIPTLNEEKNIKDVISRVKCLGLNNILVIDGKSTDNTRDVAQKLGAKVVLQEGRGKGSAVRQVMRNNYITFDFLVLLDADGSMSPEEIPIFLKGLLSGADVVKGSRFLKGGYTYDMTPMRKFGNSIMMGVVNILWSTRFTDLCYGFIAFSKNSVEKMSPMLKAEHFEIETEIFLKAIDLGLNIKEIPSTEYQRKFGTSNLHSFRDGFKIFKTIFKTYIESIGLLDFFR
jgi:glycosyltransferase involved in cell wall biosynthesis